MPIFNKRDLNNYYNRIPVERKPSDWKPFSADELKENEIECGAVMLAKLPRITGRIGRKNRRKDNKVTTYIELILDRGYDSEKQQSRNKRVPIGIDVSHIFPGMMIINDKYHDYFDRKGNLIYQPEPEENDQQQIQETAETEPEPAEIGETKIIEALDIQPNDQAPAAEAQEEDYPNQSSYITARETEDMSDYKQEPQDDAEKQKADEEIQTKIRDEARLKDHIDFLNSILWKYKETIEEQAKKRPDKHLTLYQLHRINELLRELKEIFKDCEADNYLQLAEEPDEDSPESNMTYADMDILLSTYTCTLSSYHMGKMWYKKRKSENG